MALVIKARSNEQTIAACEENKVVKLEGNWYFDPQSVDMSKLKITSRTYTCHYKGTCYWIDLDAPDAQAQNVAWVYQTPKSEYELIKNRIGFYGRTTSSTLAVMEQLAAEG